MERPNFEILHEINPNVNFDDLTSEQTQALLIAVAYDLTLKYEYRKNVSLLAEFMGSAIKAEELSQFDEAAIDAERVFRKVLQVSRDHIEISLVIEKLESMLKRSAALAMPNHPF